MMSSKDLKSQNLLNRTRLQWLTLALNRLYHPRNTSEIKMRCRWQENAALLTSRRCGQEPHFSSLLNKFSKGGSSSTICGQSGIPWNHTWLMKFSKYMHAKEKLPLLFLKHPKIQRGGYNVTILKLYQNHTICFGNKYKLLMRNAFINK